jgi:hypothetical protein
MISDWINKNMLKVIDYLINRINNFTNINNKSVIKL